MTISISQKLSPFSHLPGSSCLIPGTSVEVEAFPALLRFYEISTGERALIQELVLDVEGPLRQFTLMQDLDRGCVTLVSESYRFHILPNLELKFQKNPGIKKPLIQEELSLGSHKQQDWNLIRKRLDFREIFPIWFRLGSLINSNEQHGDGGGVFTLLNECRKSIETHRPEMIVPAFEKLFLTGFRSMLVPRIQDDDFHGILEPNVPITLHNPIRLLKEGSVLIRSLFLTTSGNEIAILPNLPPEFFCGRIIRLQCGEYGEMDLEWTKKMIHRILFRSSKDGMLYLHFKSNLKHFRLRELHQQKGLRLSCGESFEIKSGHYYLLDQFQK